jgi:hypothetical protein
MRNARITLFELGLLAYVAWAFFIGQDMGDTLWQAGIALMLTDLVCTKYWPGVIKA